MENDDTFFEHLDAEQLLKDHAPHLLAAANEMLAASPTARVAGVIALPDAPAATAIRGMLRPLGTPTVPAGLLVGIVPRAAVEPLLSACVADHLWREQGWQRQNVLPVVVSTRGGHRFGCFGLGRASNRSSSSM